MLDRQLLGSLLTGGLLVSTAWAQTPRSPGTTTALAPAVQPIAMVQIQEGRVGLQVAGRLVTLPSGAYAGPTTSFQVAGGAITELTAMAGARLIMYVPRVPSGGEEGQKAQPIAPTSSRTGESGGVRTFQSPTRIRIQSASVAPDGSLRLRATTGESYALPNGTFRGEGTAQGTLLSLSDGRPISVALPAAP